MGYTCKAFRCRNQRQNGSQFPLYLHIFLYLLDLTSFIANIGVSVLILNLLLARDILKQIREVTGLLFLPFVWLKNTCRYLTVLWKETGPCCCRFNSLPGDPGNQELCSQPGDNTKSRVTIDASTHCPVDQFKTTETSTDSPGSQSEWYMGFTAMQPDVQKYAEGSSEVGFLKRQWNSFVSTPGRMEDFVSQKWPRFRHTPLRRDSFRARLADFRATAKKRLFPSKKPEDKRPVLDQSPDGCNCCVSLVSLKSKFSMKRDIGSFASYQRF